MTTKFNMTRDINGYNGFGLDFTDTAYRTTLAASAEQHFTVPANMGMGGNGISTTSQWIAIFVFTPGASVWVGHNLTATLPSGSFSQVSNLELNPVARRVFGDDTLSFITLDANTQMEVLLYAIS